MNKTFRLLSVFGVILAVIIAFNSGMVLSAASGQEYADIKGHWAENTLKALISRGLITGVNVGGRVEIQPNRHITRAEFLTILMRANNYAVVADKVRSFKDVDAKAWFKEPVDKAVSNVIVSGYPDGSFKPNNPITRAEMAELIAKISGWKTAENADKVNSLNPFKDVEKSKWYFAGVMVNKLKGTIGGYPDGTCKPENNATRAEAMTIFSKYLDIVHPLAGTTPTPVPTNAVTQTPTPIPQVEEASLPTSTPKPIIPDTNPGLMCFNEEGKPGSRVYFQVFAYALKDLGKFDFKITYDPSIVVAVAVNKGTVKDSDYLGQYGSVDLSQADTGTIFVSSSDTSPVLGSSGTLFTVTFRVRPDAAGSTQVILSGKNSSTPEFYKTNGDPISSVTNANGTITIKD